LFHKDQLHITIDRLCYQLIEQHDDFKGVCLVGIQKKGAILGARILKRLKEISGMADIPFGKLDITFFRDDFRQGNKILVPHNNEMEFLVEGMDVILVDDVLYTGRTIQAALQALTHYGRARSVELLVLIDRRFNRALPIQSHYVGLKVDALDKAYVKVELEEEGMEDRVLFFDAETED
jgi:pyrimidine operon attenuation protein/uracil phosphoribosyltransferase